MTVRAPGPIALVLVDLQRDFLERPGLTPDADTVSSRAAELLAACRSSGTPVAHVHTVVRPDGADAMPHWAAAGVEACRAGTAGVRPPQGLEPGTGELIVEKQFFSAFSTPGLDAWLRAQGIARIVVAGVYTHGCVRETVIDAYEQGYEVVVAEDAVATYDIVHGTASRDWLDGRAAHFCAVVDVIAMLVTAGGHDTTTPRRLHPVALIAGAPVPADGHRRYVHRDPCDSTMVLAEVPLAGAAEVEAAARAGAEAQRDWAGTDVGERAALLDRWAAALVADAPRLAAAIVTEVGKPVGAAEDEIQRAVSHVEAAARVLQEYADPPAVGSGVVVRHRPVGVIGAVMPWNNPVALPVGKVAPALAFGNAVVLKPAPEAAGTALALVETLRAAGAPASLLNVVLGDRGAAQALCDEPAIDAVTVTGSVATGRSVAARCARSAKPVQAELGGNNAAIVLADADLERVVPALVRAAFAFAGQRCTAIRRFVVEAPIAARFETAAIAAMDGVVVGDPRERSTEVGPMISTGARDRVLSQIEAARAGGARLVAGGEVRTDLGAGAWLAPTLLADVDPASPIAQEETFGPVAVMITVPDLDAAIAVANGVEQGLVMAVCSDRAEALARVLDEGQAGIVQIGPGPLAVHADAPFGGWKASGIGPPEHGAWDAAFYSRPQAVYGAAPC